MAKEIMCWVCCVFDVGEFLAPHYLYYVLLRHCALLRDCVCFTSTEVVPKARSVLFHLTAKKTHFACVV